MIRLVRGIFGLPRHFLRYWPIYHKLAPLYAEAGWDYFMLGLGKIKVAFKRLDLIWRRFLCWRSGRRLAAAQGRLDATQRQLDTLDEREANLKAISKPAVGSA